ncbi:MAG: class I SAM-dependent methyltransferase [Thermoflexales bacterium]|nr:class I SAM-dependent methyltransferase [Thermoflexales bacterium]
MKLVGGLHPESRLLDLGCGCGALALQLRQYVKPERGGSYVGLDVHLPSIRWCQRHIVQPGFRFAALDAFNASFHPNGQRAFDYRAALAAYAPVDVVAAKSLFTHLRPEDVQAYLWAVADVLAANGRFVFTAFLFDPNDDLEKTTVRFPFGDARFRHAYAHRVESAVAYAASYMLEMLQAAGWTVLRHFRGGWRSHHSGLSFQDVVVACRAADRVQVEEP